MIHLQTTLLLDCPANYRSHSDDCGEISEKIGRVMESAKGGEEENCLCCGEFIEESIATENEGGHVGDGVKLGFWAN